MRRIYWKGARRGSFPVAEAFPGKKKKKKEEEEEAIKLHPDVF